MLELKMALMNWCQSYSYQKEVTIITKYLTKPKLWLSLIWLTVVTTIFNLLPLKGDDVANIKAHNLQTLHGILINNYHMFFNWTSRIIIDPIMYMSTNLIPYWLFALLTGIITLPILWYLTDDTKAKNFKPMLLAFFIPFIFPLPELGTAGYIATSVTYLWPIGTLAMSLLLLKHYHDVIANSIAFCLLLFSFNNEQVAIAGFIIAGYYLIKNHHLPLTVYLTLIPNLLLHAFAPGNHHRAILETKNWYSQFRDLNFFQKFDIGTVTTIQHYLFGHNLVIFIFAVALVFAYNKKHPLTSLLPVTMVIGGNILSTVTSRPLYWCATHNPYLNHMTIAHLLLGLIFIVTCLYLLNNHHDYQIILLAGLASRIAIGFSPTIYASATRTFVICDALLLYLAAKLLIKQYQVKPQSFGFILFTLIVLVVNNIQVSTALIINQNLWINIHQVSVQMWTTIFHRWKKATNC